MGFRGYFLELIIQLYVLNFDHLKIEESNLSLSLLLK